MTAVVVALAEPFASAISDDLSREGITVAARVAPDSAMTASFASVDALLIPASRSLLTAELVALCDRSGVRIVPVGGRDARLCLRLGLTPPLAEDATVWQIIAALDEPLISHRPSPAPEESPGHPHRILAVWGPQGAPGRSTVAIQLAVELTRTGRHTAIVDADTIAPSLALLLGLSDDAPGIAAACRRAELGTLDAAELTRLALPLETSGGTVDVLGGLNRPSRWPELSSARLRLALAACRGWAERTVIDIGASFETDEEISHDIAGPRRYAATSTVLADADHVIAVAAADPLGMSRFIRDYAELRRLVGKTPITVVANRVRPGPLGIDARGQIRRTLERFAGITDVVFLPHDQRGIDASLLHARPLADVTPRSPLATATRRLATAIEPHREQGKLSRRTTAGSWKGSFRGARSLARAREVPEASRRASDQALPN